MTKKSTSRSARRDDAVSELRTALGNDSEDAKVVSSYKNAAENADLGELESLLEEMQTWRDNMEEKMSHVPKFEEVSECADSLESAVSSLQDAVNEATDVQNEEDVENSQDEIEAALEEVEAIDFPGMF